MMQVVIPHVARNDGLLQRNLPYLEANLKPERIIIIGDIDCRARWAEMTERIVFIDEDKLLPGLTLDKVRRRLAASGVPASRAGWYLQQFLKMGWALHSDCADWYLVWDSDTFPLRPIAVFGSDGKPIFRTKTEYNETYFITIKQLIGIDKMIDPSFIAESMLVNRAAMRCLIADICAPEKRPVEAFPAIIMEVVALSSNPYTAFSEFETYGNYVMTTFPDMYRLEPSNAIRNGAKYFGLKPSRHDLARLARRYDIVSFERWNRIVPPFIWLQKFISRVLALTARN